KWLDERLGFKRCDNTVRVYQIATVYRHGRSSLTKFPSDLLTTPRDLLYSTAREFFPSLSAQPVEHPGRVRGLPYSNGSADHHAHLASVPDRENRSVAISRPNWPIGADWRVLRSACA